MTQGISRIFQAIAALCVAAVAIALLSQYAFGMAPCAWCVFQRLIYLVIAVVCGLALAAGPHRSRIQAALGLLVFALATGGTLAAWHQFSVASHSFSCDLTFADRFMVDSGLDANLPWLFGIFASCMDARVQVLGVEYAIWSLLLFTLVGVLGLAALFRGLVSRRPV